MNDWRPDWQDERSYPQDSDSYMRFAWEFLRRNGAYQEAFTRCHQFKPALLGDLRVISQPCVRTEKQASFFEIIDRFQVQWLVDPRLDFDDANGHLSFGTFEELDEQRKFRGLHGIAFFDYAFVQRYSTAVVPLSPERPEDIVMRFDLSRDINKQMEEAQQILLERQKNYQPPKDSDKARLRRLLRVLDAKQLLPKVRHKTIGEKLHAGTKPEHHMKAVNRDIKDATDVSYLDLVRLDLT